MTTRIYYTDAERREFDATVVEALEHEGRPAVVLDRTAFYPTSGGQPFDTGRLARSQVLDVVDAGDTVLHVLDAPIAAGGTVHGVIDWDRRFDHMQQHTGQHVLSAAFERLSSHRTVSFHMGSETASIDLDREASRDEIDRAVDEANRVVWDDLPVTIRFVSDDEAATLPLRKAPARDGTLRLVDVSGFDLSACGGTHVARTGAIGLIAATATERFKGGSRITFVCGGRALRALRTYRDVVAGSVRILSVLPPELPAAIEKLQNDAKDQRKTIARLQEALAVLEAERIYAAAPEIDGLRRIVHVAQGVDAQALKAMATTIAGKGRAIAVVIAPASPPLVVIARSTDAPADANAILRQLTARFGGKGGGKPDLAQGGGMSASAEEIAGAARELLSSAGTSPAAPQ